MTPTTGHRALPAARRGLVEGIGGVLVNPALLRHSRLLTKVGGRISPHELSALVETDLPSHDATVRAVV